MIGVDEVQKSFEKSFECVYMHAWMGVHIHIEPFYATTLALAHEVLSVWLCVLREFFLISFFFHRATDGGTVSMLSLASN